MFHAFFSDKQKELVGSSIYRRADGSDVQVTEVVQVKVEGEDAPPTHCKDHVYLGLVVEYVDRFGKGPNLITDVADIS